MYRYFALLPSFIIGRHKDLIVYRFCIGEVRAHFAFHLPIGEEVECVLTFCSNSETKKNINFKDNTESSI